MSQLATDRVLDSPDSAPVLDIVIPVYNEEVALEDCVLRLLEHLASFPWPARVTIADNASTDQTPLIAHRLTREYAEVATVRLAEKGRGRALKRSWSASSAEVLAYMDVDLSTDLNALLPLVAPLLSGHSDLAIGNRLNRAASVERGAKREVISRCYNLLLRGTLRTGFGDAQCGFKAIRRDAAAELLPLVRDDGWFFDTELLVLAERAGLRIHQVPVDWSDDPTSTVDLLATAAADLRGIVRVGRSLATGSLPLDGVAHRLGRPPRPIRHQLPRFLAIGLASTIAFALLYLGLRPTWGPIGANAAALSITAVANTAANRRFTFGVRGRHHVVRHQLQGLVVFAAGLGVTTGALSAAHAAGYTRPLDETVLLTVANVLVTVLRFLAFRGWVFARQTRMT